MDLDRAAMIAELASLPPLDFDKVRKDAAEQLGVRATTLDAEVSRLRVSAARPLGVFDLHEDGVALAFRDKHRDDLRFCHTTGAWFVWDGSRWKAEKTRLAFEWARAVCREIANRGDETERVALARASSASAVERFAQADRAFAVTADNWDADPFLLGTPSGTVDLKTGEMRLARRSDFITRSCTVTPSEAADCPQWLAFLKQATRDDADLIRFLQQYCGYCLTGDTREHSFVFVFGDGGNGKGVFLNTVSKTMGDYAVVASMDTFTASAGDRHPTDLAMLAGARLVCASETEEGRAWAEVRIKQLTGGDPITARFMRRDFFTFTPVFKLFITGNHKPVLRNVDEAARRRINMAPFVHKPEKPDRELEAKLEAERPAILRWMIDGCLSWQKEGGLTRPDAVVAATKDYFSDQDAFAQWLDDQCERRAGIADTNASLFASWRNFAKDRGEEIGSGKRFSASMQRQGFEPIKDTKGVRGRGFAGVRVAVRGVIPPEPPTEPEPPDYEGAG